MESSIRAATSKELISIMNQIINALELQNKPIHVVSNEYGATLPKMNLSNLVVSNGQILGFVDMENECCSICGCDTEKDSSYKVGGQIYCPECMERKFKRT